MQQWHNCNKYVVRVSHLHDGLPHIAGTAITVFDIYESHSIIGMYSEDIANLYNLSLVQVYAMLTYIHENLPMVEQSYNRYARSR
jgi:uncharacterized protein (DUF433 family)